ncbi:hypothetical protein MACH08_29220 [Oceanobacillus kimchii]|uniref:Uncharacterized protein n=1 Tax=Oceanobacillus kimchii TaxID=746691 RepID=A0ABQ5TNE9_9BACI|nr:hypothetical protein MACH08_29220 [Oceanobacillus kimchii]
MDLISFVDRNVQCRLQILGDFMKATYDIEDLLNTPTHEFLFRCYNFIPKL